MRFVKHIRSSGDDVAEGELDMENECSPTMASGSIIVPSTTIENEFSNITRNHFPDDFVFGTGTSAYQNEGGATKGGRGLSVWDVFTLRTPGIQPYVTLFHWDLPFLLEQEYGGFLDERIVDDFRDYAELCFWEFGDRVKHWFTLNEPWTYTVQGYVARIFPPGKKAPALALGPTNKVANLISTLSLASVNKVADNLIPFNKVVNKIGHNFIPYRGFNMSDLDQITTYDDDFTTYSDVHDRTRNAPLNETVLLTQMLSAPKERSVSSEEKLCWSKQAKEGYTVARNLLLAHAAAVQSYRNKFKEHQKGKIGITLVCHWFEPFDDTNVEDKKASKRALDFMLGWFLEPVLSGRYPKNMTDFVPRENLKPFSREESELLKGSIDFLGLNYYTAWYATNDPYPDAEEGYYRDQKVKFLTEKDGKPIGESTGSWWLYIVPWGIYKLLKYVNSTYNNTTYNLPVIYITENGVDEQNNPKLTAYDACRDKRRVNYFRDHLGNILKAMNDGTSREKVKVKGYFAWSWCDNFEWKDGYTVRFGIIYVDYMNHLKRYPKDSAMWFSKFLVKKTIVA
ncbi:hypothetical protein DH2020_025536 [Rehmannia glutinosa]|uniref:Uncharacterized protein n=1 Tax=Rehmannia glutinosa TaxID=99300 RepID=A0ABR0W1U5_REHGL